MIEVLPAGNGWIWRMICATGRTLVQSTETFPCDQSAFAAARAYRATFWAISDAIDHRMARAI